MREGQRQLCEQPLLNESRVRCVGCLSGWPLSASRVKCDKFEVVNSNVAVFEQSMECGEERLTYRCEMDSRVQAYDLYDRSGS